jgi:hypothetical protein
MATGPEFRTIPSFLPEGSAQAYLAMGAAHVLSIKALGECRPGSDVVFAEGMVRQRGRYLLYHGAADKYVGVAEVPTIR